MKRRQNGLLPGAFAVAVVTGAAGLLWNATRTTVPGDGVNGVLTGGMVSPTQGGGGQASSPEPIVVAPPPVGDTKKGGGARTATYYVVVTNEDGSRLEARKLSLTTSAGKGPEQVARAAINAMARLNVKDSPLPMGTEARSVTIGADGVATVDFNKAVKDNFKPGDENEALLINSILGVMAQFPGVKTVQFLVEGAKIDAFGGTMSLTDPLPVTPPSGDATAQTAQGGSGDGQP